MDYNELMEERKAHDSEWRPDANEVQTKEYEQSRPSTNLIRSLKVHMSKL